MSGSPKYALSKGDAKRVIKHTAVVALLAVVSSLLTDVLPNIEPPDATYALLIVLVTSVLSSLKQLLTDTRQDGEDAGKDSGTAS